MSWFMETRDKASVSAIYKSELNILNKKSFLAIIESLLYFFFNCKYFFLKKLFSPNHREITILNMNKPNESNLHVHFCSFFHK